MSVTIELDRPRTLKFSLRAIRDLERQMGGLPTLKIINLIGDGGGEAIVMAMWAGLKHEDPSLTINLTEKLLEQFLDTHSVLELSRALNDSFMECGLLKNIGAEEPAGNVPAVTT